VLPWSTEVAELLAALQAALPHAPPPDQQHVHYPAMLYTTVARLLAPARRPDTSWATGEVCVVVGCCCAVPEGNRWCWRLRWWPLRLPH
jgi:hypothetical protein